jgi:hypothetical protein
MHLSNLSLILLVVVSAIGCSGEPDSLSARAGRPSPEQVNKILVERYAANENFSEQIETIGGRIKIALDLSYTGLNNDDLEKLDLPKYLTQLDLAGTAVTDEGLDALEGCKHLQHLNLDHTQVTDECLEIIKELPAVYRVNLNGTRVSPDAQREMIRFLRIRRPKTTHNAPQSIR